MHFLASVLLSQFFVEVRAYPYLERSGLPWFGSIWDRIRLPWRPQITPPLCDPPFSLHDVKGNGLPPPREDKKIPVQFFCGSPPERLVPHVLTIEIEP